jgi:hypothetical protein
MSVRSGTTYGTRRRWARLYSQITAEHHGPRSQLEALHQASHAGADPEDVDAVRAAPFAAHG